MKKEGKKEDKKKRGRKQKDGKCILRVAGIPHSPPFSSPTSGPLAF
jgi:hypothetical protein